MGLQDIPVLGSPNVSHRQSTNESAVFCATSSRGSPGCFGSAKGYALHIHSKRSASPLRDPRTPLGRPVDPDV
eukprot:6186688-Pleurochrysis_carterae.AAC.1